MRRPKVLSTDHLVRAAIVLGAGLIFALDLTPIRGAADGAAYTLVVALAAYSDRRAIIGAAVLGAALTIIGPLIGAEEGETLLQIVSGRVFGLLVIAVLTGVLFHQTKVRAESSASEQEVAAYNSALRKIARRALFADKALKRRFESVTELVVQTLGVDRACVARLEQAGETFRLYEVWDRRKGRHYSDLDPPVCYSVEYARLVENDFAIMADDVRTSPLYRDHLEYYESRNVRAVLHAGAPYREQVISSLIVSHGQPRHWTEREINFAKSVADIVALLFAIDHAEKILERLDFVSESIFVEDQNGRIEYANRAARDLVGGEASILPFALDPLATDRDEHHIIHNGRDLEIHRRKLPDGGVLMRVDDVTARNAAFAETKRMQTRLEQSAKLHAMGRLASGLAHDFNNILSAIMGFAQILSKMLGPSEQPFAERILSVCRKGKGITEEILAFARTSSVDRQQVDLAEVLSGSLDMVPHETGSKLLVDIPHELLPVNGNSAQLTQLIQNLVINAHHACEDIEGRITITAGRATQQEVRDLIRPSGRRNERLLGEPNIAKDYCFLRVADNGHGIPPEIMDRIFEPFFTTKGKRQGSGLGLAVVHGVVDSHEGCCHVLSEPGQGTTFTVYLPLLSDAAVAMRNAGTIDTAAIRGGEKILIVDDNFEFAETLKIGLQQLGYSAMMLNDPHEALAAVRSDPKAFDVLITDQVMPKMDGVDLIAAVKTHHGGIKVVLCTGANVPEIEEKAMAAGADAFLRKPFDATEIAFHLRALLKKIEQAA